MLSQRGVVYLICTFIRCITTGIVMFYYAWNKNINIHYYESLYYVPMKHNKKKETNGTFYFISNELNIFLHAQSTKGMKALEMFRKMFCIAEKIKVETCYFRLFFNTWMTIVEGSPARLFTDIQHILHI